MPPPSCAGLTIRDLAQRTGYPPKLLSRVLAEELRRPSPRVRRDPADGRYRLVADRFGEGTLAALAQLDR
jgi:DNA-binding IclR family transcriptional regulator